MKPYARYLFESPSPRWNHRLIEHTGNDVPDFPAVWLPPNAPQYAIGVKSINIKEIQDNTQYTHALLKRDIMCAGINISNRSSGYGDFGDYALLAEIGKNSFNGIRYISLLNIWFFKDMKQQSEILFDQWISGELVLEDNLHAYLLKKRIDYQNKIAVTSSSPHHIL